MAPFFQNFITRSLSVILLRHDHRSLNHITATTSCCNFFIFWMDFCPHNGYLAAEKGRNHTRVQMIRKPLARGRY